MFGVRTVTVKLKFEICEGKRSYVSLLPFILTTANVLEQILI